MDVGSSNLNAAVLVVNALTPAQVEKVVVEEDERRVEVVVPEDQQSLAIGRRGQNARLSSRLMGWDVQVRKDESEQEQFEARLHDAAGSLADQIGLDEETADKLFRAGGATPELILQMPADYIAGALEITEEEATNILETVQTNAG